MHPDQTHRKIKKYLESFYRRKRPTTIPNSLPLIEAMVKKLANNESFVNYDALFIQHHLGSLVPRVKAMESCGLHLGRAWFVDIPYSTNRDVVSRLKAEKIIPQQMSKAFNDPLADYSHAQSARVSLMMHSLMERSDPKPLLVIDDGAYFLRFLLDLLYYAPHQLSHFNNCCVVEQTTRGHRFIEQHGRAIIEKCSLSIVSIAESNTKKYFEGPFIGVDITRSILRSLGKERLKNAKKVVVLGYGTVGHAVVASIASLFRKVHIDIFDPNWHKLESKDLPSLKCTRVKRLGQDQNYDVVIGCTGGNSFLIEDRHLLSNDSVLVSGSSGDVEFNRFGFVELADRLENDEIEIFRRDKIIRGGIHSPISIRFENGKKLTILNAGFPANFDGSAVESLPYSAIQATHALLFAAAIEATTASRPGFKKISKKNDNGIFKLAIKHLDT